ncbi:M24 family metallopeptidase [Mycoplasma todarodis]|uniref:Xaa-Pro aminopeptidase n=1 Tax=Mycoplasma todarodis TaxID=1937191 RepID=A0A4R0XRT7_9MOLU|nr:aminopeptidase P family protein [Mycoplasma todarodis]TCG11595.1 Xaa-Pro aminopeptidase [Mycoplasma todarodis]
MIKDKKIEVIKDIMKEEKLDAIYVWSHQNRFWYANVHSSDGTLIIDNKDARLFVDSRYIITAKESAKNVDVFLTNKTPIKEVVSGNEYKRIGFEADYIPYSEFIELQELFPNAQLIPLQSQTWRNVKNKDEISRIRKASQIALTSLEEIMDEIKPGITEKEIANLLEARCKFNGADKMGFETIVGSGPNGAKAHSVPGDKKLIEGEYVVVDFGVTFKGYMCDITRTIPVSKEVDPKMKEIANIVRKAQQLAIAAVKPGVSGATIDAIARDYITEKGYGDKFGHGTGHGLGIDMHEFPDASKYNKDPLEVGNVITVEPGIYIEGLGGYRIEDDILVTKDGYEILSKI